MLDYEEEISKAIDYILINNHRLIFLVSNPENISEDDTLGFMSNLSELYLAFLEEFRSYVYRSYKHKTYLLNLIKDALKIMSTSFPLYVNSPEIQHYLSIQD